MVSLLLCVASLVNWNNLLNDLYVTRYDLNDYVSTSAVDIKASVKSVILTKDRPIADQMVYPNAIYIIEDDFDAGNPSVKDVKITTNKVLKWAGQTYFYTSVALPKGKAITILDRYNCTFLNAKATDPTGTSSFFSSNSGTTVYIASEKPGTYKNAYRIDDIVAIPSGCTLKFNGGSIQNCYLTGNFLIESPYTTIFDNTLVDAAANNYWICVKWFGARGDGRTDDTEAIKRAVVGKNSIVAYFPKGQYVISSSIKVTKTLQHWIGESVKGQDYLNNAYYRNSEFVCVGNCNTPYVYAPKQIDNLSFFRKGEKGNSTALMLSCPYVFDDPHIRNVYISGFDKALHIENVAGAVISKCDFRENNTAIYSMQRYSKNVESGYVTDVRFEDCKIIHNAGYAFYKDFYGPNEVKAPDRANIVFQGCDIEFNAKTVDADISHRTYNVATSPAVPSLGHLHFIDSGGEGGETFIKANRSYIQFDNCSLWCNSMKFTNSELVLRDSRFPFCTLICGGEGANFISSSLDNQSSSIKVEVGYSRVADEHKQAIKTKQIGVEKVGEVKEIPVDNHFSGDEYYLLDQHMPVYVYKWKDGIDNSELFDALGNRLSDKKSGPTKDRPLPSEMLKVGFMYFDTTLNKPIWWNGKNWVDYNGKPL